MTTAPPFTITPPADLLRTHPHIRGMADSTSTAYEKHLLVEEKHLQAMGQALWDALALGDSLELAKQANGQQVLPIIIASADAAILTLPWETLYHPTYGFLGREAGFSLSRRNPTVSVALPALQREPLRVLLFTSLPDDLKDEDRLDVEAEQAAVQEALMEQERLGEIVLEMPDDGRLDTLRITLQQFQPHLVYLSGHGNFIHEHHKQRAYGSFLFEDALGNGQTISESELVACFQNTRVQLLVMSACLSAKQHPNYPHNGLSAALYRAGIPHVIGMRESVFDKAGIQFAKALLHTLGKHGTVDVALQQARAAITQPFKEAGGYRDSTNPIRTEASYGQWCLPQLLSHDSQQGLVDWSFTPQPKLQAELKTLMGQVSVPEKFRGRRRELRQWQNRLRDKTTNSLLITGIGGMGKTALAYKLLQGLHKDGYQTFTFSLRPEHDWQSIVLDMELMLAEDDTAYKKYELIQRKNLDAATQTSYFLKFLLARCGGKLALFFDNLESVQDGQYPHAITDSTLQYWLQAAQLLTKQGLKLILTSRWRLPDWADVEHYPLGKPVYGDYVAMVRLQGLPLKGKRLQTAYETLGGNFRALEFFAKATQGMSAQEEHEFTASLGKAAAESQTDMALAKVVELRSNEEIALLHRLLAYQTTVPLLGVELAGEGNVADVLQRLLAVSLVEQYANPHSQQTEYQLAPLVRHWLLANGAPEPDQTLLQKAANFLLWELEEHQNTTWKHRLATHAALLAANLTEQGQRLVLKWIVEPLNRAGMYRPLLDNWLPPLLLADNQQIKADTLNYLGKQSLHIGDYDNALNFIKQALTVTQDIGDKFGLGSALNNISTIYDTYGDYDTAFDYLQQALIIEQEIGDRSGEATTLNNIGNIILTHGDCNTALDYFKKSLAISQEISNQSGIALALQQISAIYCNSGDYNTAINYLKQSLALAQEIGDIYRNKSVIQELGNIYYALGDYKISLNYLNQSLSIAREIGDKPGESSTLNSISNVYLACSDYDNAFECLKQSLTIVQKNGDKLLEGAILNNISQFYDARGDYDVAIKYLEQSLVIAQEIGNKSGESFRLNNIGSIIMIRGDYDTALNYFKQALAIAQEINDKRLEGTILNNISQVYDARGDYDTAIKYLEQSLIIAQEIGDKSGESGTLSGIGNIIMIRGDYGTALNYFKQSLAIAQEIGKKSLEGTILNNISQIYSTHSDHDTALDYLKKSLAIAQEIGDKKGVKDALISMSTIAQTCCNYETALDYLKSSLAIAREIGDKLGIADSLRTIGITLQAQGNLITALDYLQDALVITQEMDNQNGESMTQCSIGIVLQACGHYQEALDYLYKSHDTAQRTINPFVEGLALSEIGMISQIHNDYEKAFDHYQQALFIQNNSGDKRSSGRTLSNIGELRLLCGNHDSSLDYLQQALVIQQQIVDKRGEAITLNRISQVYYAHGKYEDALDNLQTAQLIQEEIGDLANLSATLFNSGRIDWQREEKNKAMQKWLKAYKLAKNSSFATVLNQLKNLAVKSR